MPDLEQIDPRGRLDVLAYRVIERTAPRLLQPGEWDALKPLIAEVCENLLGNEPVCPDSE